MSGTASRYAIGLPYNPGRATGTYARMPVGGGGAAPNVVPQAPVLGLGSGYAPVEDTGGGTVVAPRVQGAGGAAGGGMDATLLAGALGMLPYLPDAYSTVSGWLGGGEELPLPPEFVSEADAAAQNGAPDFSSAGAGALGPNLSALAGRGFMSGTDAAMAQALDQAGIVSGPATEWIGQGGNWTGAFEPGTLAVDQAATQALLDAPIGAADGFAQMGVSPGDFVSASAPADGVGAASADGGGWLSGLHNPLGLSEALFTAPDLGLGSIGSFNLNMAPLYIPAAIFGQGMQGLAKPGGGMGATLGSAAGGMIGGVVAGPVGAALGTIAGGAIGGQIGPAPTVGRNYSAFGRFGQDGALQWGAMGGDNGGTTEDAQAFANWFGPALQQAAAAQGLQFNPAMAGAEIRVGNYDNYMRNAPNGGGFFYDPIVGNASGSPEVSAMRAGTGYGYDMWDGGPQQMAGAFLNSTLADLAARDVFTPSGQGRGIDYWNNTGGAPLGWYTPDTNFADAYAQRQGEIGGFYQGLQDRWAGNDALRQSGNFGAIHVDDRTNADWDAVWQANGPTIDVGGG